MVAEFAKRLTAARKGNGFTQEEVAKVLGVDFTSISKYENGHVEPDLTNLVTMANLYGVTVYWLLGGPEEMKQQQLNLGCDGDKCEPDPVVIKEKLATIHIPSENHYVILKNKGHEYAVLINDQGMISFSKKH